MYFIYVAQGTDKGWASVDTTTSWLNKCKENLDLLRTCQLLKEESAPWTQSLTGGTRKSHMNYCIYSTAR